jgi:hypothetical protein
MIVKNPALAAIAVTAFALGIGLYDGHLQHRLRRPDAGAFSSPSGCCTWRRALTTA